MRVKELIEVLQTFDPELTIVNQGFYDTEEPSPMLTKTGNYTVNYWDTKGKIKAIPANTEYVEI